MSIYLPIKITRTCKGPRKWSGMAKRCEGAFWHAFERELLGAKTMLNATKREAVLAMRWAMCRDFARKLRAVDLVNCA